MLIVGGRNAYASTNPSFAEVFDPKTGIFTPTGDAQPLSIRGQAATVLRDGRVLITGGEDDSSAPSSQPSCTTRPLSLSNNCPTCSRHGPTMRPCYLRTDGSR